jgi:FkbM family methyltransferase
VRLDDLKWKLLVAITRIAIPIKDATDFNVRGLGRLAATINSRRVFSSQGFRWHFDPALAFCYARLPGGAFNERETHSFLQFVLGQLDRSLTFVDVGSNFGEFVVPMAAHPKVAGVIAYEPDPRTAEMCRANLALNGLQADVRERLVGDGTPSSYVIDVLSPSESGMGEQGGPQFPTHRLDDEIPARGDFIMLIDVEGAELRVLKGGAELIRKTRPLIVFEYNLVTRKHFELADVEAELPDYQIYRLRRDGHLDRTFANTWNCVAVPAGTDFEAICRARIRP